MAKKAKPVPLVHVMKSRKVQRQVTTKFHQLTHKKAALIAQGKDERASEIKDIDAQIESMGGREKYQEASQLSTSIFSTSKWVLGRLGNLGILQGKLLDDNTRAPIRLLEVGAINTQLVVASSKPGVRMTVRAIDLRSTAPEIETQDFNQLPVPSPPDYDAIVCSMVINCVPTPEERGTMLRRLHAQLVPGGHCFLMLPLLCLNNSKFTTKKIFVQMLKALGFEIKETKETPKIWFGVLKKTGDASDESALQKWRAVTTINKDKKFRNTFAFVFSS
jgi:25S rRNA (adenine2142-N1)-methyltransferase